MKYIEENSTGFDVLEERVNIQERLILELYEDLSFFENMEGGTPSYMERHIRYSKVKARATREKIRKYLTT